MTDRIRGLTEEKRNRIKLNQLQRDTFKISLQWLAVVVDRMREEEGGRKKEQK